MLDVATEKRREGELSVECGVEARLEGCREEREAGRQRHDGENALEA